MKHDKESYIITIRRKDADAPYSTDTQPVSVPAGQSVTPTLAPAAVTAPLPGIIIGLTVHPGDSVTAGQELAILEAMKMENSILAPRSGLIRSVDVAVGDSVSEGTVLMTID